MGTAEEYWDNEYVSEEIPFEIEYIEDNQMYQGESYTYQYGINGFKEKHYEVYYINGEERTRELYDEYEFTPVNEIIVIGTKDPADQDDETYNVTNEIYFIDQKSNEIIDNILLNGWIFDYRLQDYLVFINENTGNDYEITNQVHTSTTYSSISTPWYSETLTNRIYDIFLLNNLEEEIVPGLVEEPTSLVPEEDEVIVTPEPETPVEEPTLVVPEEDEVVVTPEPETPVEESTPVVPGEDVIVIPEPELPVEEPTPLVPEEDEVIVTPEPETSVEEPTPIVPEEDEVIVTSEPETPVEESTPIVPEEDEVIVTPEPETPVEEPTQNEPVTEEPDIDDDIPNAVTPPAVNPILLEDNVISGIADTDSIGTVTLPDGTEIKAETDAEGNWIIKVPSDSQVEAGDDIKVTFEDKETNTQNESTVTVQEQEERLPDTGEVQSNARVMAAIAALFGGLLLLIKGRRKETK